MSLEVILHRTLSKAGAPIQRLDPKVGRLGVTVDALLAKRTDRQPMGLQGSLSGGASMAAIHPPIRKRIEASSNVASDRVDDRDHVIAYPAFDHAD